MASYVYRDGEMVEVPDTVITDHREIREPVTNTLIIRAGAKVTARSRLSGTVTLEQGATLEAHGPVPGTVVISDGASAVFHDRVGGTVHVHTGGAATLAPTSVALGNLKVEGVLTNQGVRGIMIAGSGEVIDAPGSTVRQPDETWEDGTVVYRA